VQQFLINSMEIHSFSLGQGLLFRPPVRIKRLHLTPDVPDVERNRIITMSSALMIVDDQAKGNDQFGVAVMVGSDGIVVTFEPAHGFLLPPGNPGFIPVNRVFSSTVPVNMIDVGAAMTPVLHIPERIGPEFNGPVVVKPDCISWFPEEPLLPDREPGFGIIVPEQINDRQ
jgi:hypothetical protein